MPNTFRAGVIGLGGMGRRHAETYQQTDGVTLAAACEARPDAADAFRGENPDVRVFADAHEMLEGEALDVLSIAANTPVFEEFALAAVEAGVSRIFCEKPMAHSLAAAQRMVDACEANGVRQDRAHLLMSGCRIDETNRDQERYGIPKPGNADGEEDCVEHGSFELGRPFG